MRFVLIAAVALSGCAEESAALPFGTDAESCGMCHEAERDAWSASAHATSGTSPVFEALLDEVGRTWGDVAVDSCIGCHQPGHGGDVGIGCVSCHAATGNTGERDGRLRVDLEIPLAGPSGAGSNGAHATRQTGFLTSASLCGTCHEVTGPSLLEEPTLSEYRESEFAATGTTCATCHMPAGEHRFVGIDPAWDGDHEARQRAIDDARTLMAEAVALDVTRDGDEAVITVTNVGAGHAVPTGAAFLRDLWIDVSFGDHAEDERVLSLGAEATSVGEPVALITDADAITPRGLAAGETRVVRVSIPEGTTTVVATLRLRAIRWEVLNALGLESRREEVPTIDVVSSGLAP